MVLITHTIALGKEIPQNEVLLTHFFLINFFLLAITSSYLSLQSLKLKTTLLLLFMWCYGCKSLSSTFMPVKLIQNGLFRGCSQMGMAAKRPPYLNVTHPIMVKLGTVIPYLKKIQKMYESCHTLLVFSWHQHFFTRNQQIAISRNTDIDSILIYNF